MAKMGRPPLEAFKRLTQQICLRLTDAETGRLNDTAKQKGRSRTSIIRIALNQYYLKEHIHGNQSD